MLFLSAFLAFCSTSSAHSIDHSAESRSALIAARSLCSRDISCILNAEAVEGPFYVAEPLVRSSIIEDCQGAILNLEIEVVDVRTCEVVEDSVYVDIWHADSEGQYSGWATGSSLETISSFPVSSADATLFDLSQGGDVVLKKRGIPVEPSRYLRGVQRVKDGKVRFETIVPGWYQGRADHIHIRIHSANSSVVDGHLLGGTVSHTGQLFFEDDFIESLRDVPPYSLRTLMPKSNEDDSQYQESRGFEQIVTIEKGKVDGTFQGRITVGIDPSKIQKPSDDHGGRGPPHKGGPGHPVLETVIMIFFVLLLVGGAVYYWRSTKAHAQEYQIRLDDEEVQSS